MRAGCHVERRADRGALIRLSVLALACAAALTCPAQARFDFAATAGNLPKNVIPSAYRITLAPDLTKLIFSGHEEIDVEVFKATRVVTVNAAAIKVRNVVLRDAAANWATVSMDGARHRATFHFQAPLALGRHTLLIDYSGAIPATPAGIYYNDYPTSAGKRRMLVTQFESIDARRMFPGWDEPVFKATFELSVALPSDLAVSSNMPVARVLARRGAALTQSRSRARALRARRACRAIS